MSYPRLPRVIFYHLRGCVCTTRVPFTCPLFTRSQFYRIYCAPHLVLHAGSTPPAAHRHFTAFAGFHYHFGFAFWFFVRHLPTFSSYPFLHGHLPHTHGSIPRSYLHPTVYRALPARCCHGSAFWFRTFAFAVRARLHTFCAVPHMTTHSPFVHRPLDSHLPHHLLPAVPPLGLPVPTHLCYHYSPSVTTFLVPHSCWFVWLYMVLQHYSYIPCHMPPPLFTTYFTTQFRCIHEHSFVLPFATLPLVCCLYTPNTVPACTTPFLTVVHSLLFLAFLVYLPHYMPTFFPIYLPSTFFWLPPQFCQFSSAVCSLHYTYITHGEEDTTFYPTFILPFCYPIHHGFPPLLPRCTAQLPLPFAIFTTVRGSGYFIGVPTTRLRSFPGYHLMPTAFSAWHFTAHMVGSSALLFSRFAHRVRTFVIGYHRSTTRLYATWLLYIPYFGSRSVHFDVHTCNTTPRFGFYALRVATTCYTMALFFLRGSLYSYIPALYSILPCGAGWLTAYTHRLVTTLTLVPDVLARFCGQHTVWLVYQLVCHARAAALRSVALVYYLRYSSVVPLPPYAFTGSRSCLRLFWILHYYWFARFLPPHLYICLTCGLPYCARHTPLHHARFCRCAHLPHGSLRCCTRFRFCYLPILRTLV